MQDQLLMTNGNMISLMKRFNNKNILLKIIHSNKIINFTKIKETNNNNNQEKVITKIQTIILILNPTNKNKGQNKRERITLQPEFILKKMKIIIKFIRIMNSTNKKNLKNSKKRKS